MEWEVGLIEWIQKVSGSMTGTAGAALSFIGGEIGLMLIVIIIFFCWKKETGRRLALIVTMINAWLPILKSFVLRPRPYMEYPDRVKGYADIGNSASLEDVAAQGYSFPSTHSASSAALFVPLANEIKKRWMWIVAVVLIFLTGIGRAMTGMHYPTDIITGWLLGLAGAGVCLLLEKKVKNILIQHLILLITVLPGLFFVRTEDYYTSLGMLIGLIFAVQFEQKYVNFKETRNIWAMILRVAGALGTYFILNTLLKLPFSKEFLANGTMGAFLIRTARYAINIFIILGVYPLVFPLFEKRALDKRAK